jgi:hypothetical protein
LPVLKREVHRQALVAAATSGSPKFFLGTDSAPHAAALKEQSVCGAGCFTAPAALELYAEAFEAVGALHKLEAFASLLLDEENEGCAEAVDIMRRDTPMGLSSRADALFHAANTIRARRKS